jgi:hypothetical protein
MKSKRFWANFKWFMIAWCIGEVIDYALNISEFTALNILASVIGTLLFSFGMSYVFTFVLKK